MEELTEQEIEDYINYTMSSGVSHIAGELKWLISHVNDDAKDTIRDIVENVIHAD